MEVMENVAETTGLGLGVHVCIDPKTAERYFVTDGQKDIAACFDRRTSRIIVALKYDWEPNDQNLAMAWRNGGTLKISKIYPDPATGKYDYLGTKGQKIEWEMVPMGELFVEEGTLPGADALHLSGADGTIWHPSGRWAPSCGYAAARLFSMPRIILSRYLLYSSTRTLRTIIRSTKSITIIGRSNSTRSFRLAMKSGFPRTGGSAA
jgi:hypothetical protein